MKTLYCDTGNFKKDGSVFKRTASRGIVRKFNPDGTFKLLMIHGKDGDYKFPGGGMEENEDLADTLAREISEETGFSMVENSEEEFCVIVERRPAEHADMMLMENHYFLCDVEDLQREQNLDDYEKKNEYKVIWIEAEKALELNGEILMKDNVPWVKREIMALRELLEMGRQSGMM